MSLLYVIQTSNFTLFSIPDKPFPLTNALSYLDNDAFLIIRASVILTSLLAKMGALIDITQLFEWLSNFQIPNWLLIDEKSIWWARATEAMLWRARTKVVFTDNDDNDDSILNWEPLKPIFEVAGVLVIVFAIMLIVSD